MINKTPLHRYIGRFAPGIFRKGSFGYNLSVFGGGSVFAFLLGFLFTPVLARIYTPEAYGYLAFFNTTLAICVSLSTLSLTDALILPEKPRKFYQLSGLLLCLAVGCAGVFGLIYFLAREVFVAAFSIEEIGNWLYLIPVLILLNTAQQIVEAKLIRSKKFARTTLSNTLGIVSSKSSVLTIGLLSGSTPWGLIQGEWILRLVNIIASIRREGAAFFRKIIRHISVAELKATFKEFRNYPLHILPSSLLTRLSLYVPVYAIGFLYDSEFLGQYSLAISFLGIPIQIIGFSFGKVFLQRINETYHASGAAAVAAQTIRFFYFMLVIGALGYGIIYAAGPRIFTFVAGGNWETSGKIASALALPLIFQIAVISISPVFRVLHREKAQFVSNIWSALFFVGSLILLILVLSPGKMELIILLSWLILIRQLFVLGFAFYIARINWIKHLMLAVLVAGVILVGYHLVRLLIES